MQSLRENVRNVLKALLAIGFGIQIVLGLCWMFGNITGFQQFGDSYLYEKISRILVCDEYEGILYPLLIKGMRGPEYLTGIPYYIWLYFLQLSVAFVAAFRLMRAWNLQGKFAPVWGSLGLMTFPFAMQCHLAVLPQSLLSSLLLLQLAAVKKAGAGKASFQKKEFISITVLWVLEALLLPEYAVAGVIPVLAYLVVAGKKGLVFRLAAMLVCLGVIIGVNSLTQVPGAYDRTQNSVSWMLAKRTLWPRVDYDYGQWPGEVQLVSSPLESFKLNYYPENLDQNLGRLLEENYGVERARRLLLEMAKLAWSNHKRPILHDAAWDLAGYTFSAPIVSLQLDGRGYSSGTGRNYDIMRQKTLQLTGWYVRYSCFWFVIAGIGAFCVFLLQKKNNLRGWLNVSLVASVLSGCFLATYYVFCGAGLMDYKKTIVIGLLWIAWIMGQSMNQREETGCLY